jgi:carboxylesterase
MADVLAGAEPLSHAGDRRGALLIHGFTGNPSSMRPVAEAFVAAGWSVELPRLPGHGTTIEEMCTTGWADWTAEVAAAHARLAARTDTMIVGGLSMGGSLTLWAGLTLDGIAGLVCINPKAYGDATLVEDLAPLLDTGITVLPGIGSDIAKEGVTELVYDGTPVGPLIELMRGVGAQEGRYGELTLPMLLLSSTVDNVIPPAEGDRLAAAYGGPVERHLLERSYHVATLDHDAELIRTLAVAFGERVTA